MRDKIGKTVRGKIGRYKIVRPLGHGGMGVLFVAKNIKTKKEVVIKFALEGEGEKTNKEKLTREIDILRTFQTTKPKNVVGYEDDSEGVDGEELFLVEEKLEGKNLLQKIHELGAAKKLDIDTIIKFSKDVADALGDIHEQGAIHRDLKPENLVVERRNGEEHCVLVDLGIGKFIKDDTTGRGMGTEKWSCKHWMTNPARVFYDCDIYALGRVMFYMATGRFPDEAEYPFGDDRWGNMMYRARSFNPALPEDLSDLIDDIISFAGYEKDENGIKRQIEPAHKMESVADVVQRLEVIVPSTYQQQRVQPRKHTAQTVQVPLQQGPHIILGGRRYEIVKDRIEIGRIHDCLNSNGACSRGVIYDHMESSSTFAGFDYPRNPDIEIPLIGSAGESVAEDHHIRIWKDKGQWYVKDLDTPNWSALLKNNNWVILNDEKTGKGRTEIIDGNWAKLAIGYRSGGRTEIEFSFYKQ